MRFLDDDPRIRIEIGFRPRPEEQRLIDAVLALDGEGREVAKTELGVKIFGLTVVMQHRQIQITQAATHEVLDQVPHQHFADTGPRALRIHRQAPQAAAVLWIVEGFLVIEAHDAADHRAAVFIFGEPVHRPALMMRGQARGIDRQHAAGLIQQIDRLPVRFALRAANAEAAKHASGLAVIAEPQAQSVGRVEKQLRRFQTENLLRCGDVQSDIAFAGLFVEQFLRQGRRVRKGVADQQPAPAAMHCNGVGAQCAAVFGQTRLQAFIRRCLTA